MPQTDAPLFTLYLAAPGGAAFTPALEEAAIAFVSARFSSFTMRAATGVHEGRRLPTLMFQIAEHDRAAVAGLMGALAHRFGQAWVGMTQGGRHTSVPTRAG